MKKVLILIFCAALFFAVGGFFLWTALTDDTVFLVPSVLMLLCACVFVYLLIKELFIGYNEYRVDGTNMSVSRRGKLIASIPSSDIADLVCTVTRTMPTRALRSVEDVYTADREARARVLELASVKN